MKPKLNRKICIELVLDFIKRRFPTDSNWLNGNCYYFALILKDRFPDGVILYDVIDGHFVTMIGGVMYDWSGIVLPEEDETKHFYVEWDKFEDYDELQKQSIISGCIL